MARVYAARTTLHSKALKADQTFDRAANEVWQWAVRDREATSKWQDGDHALEHGTVRCFSHRDDPQQARRLLFRHPDDDAPQAIWTTTCDLLRQGDSVMGTVLLQRDDPGDPEDRIPVLSVPNVVHRLAAIGTFAGVHRITSSPLVISGREEMETLIEGLLLDPNRSLPVIVVTPDERGTYAIDEQRLWSFARSMIGVAWVALIGRPDDTYLLSDLLGRPRSCYLGAIRIYRPDLTLQANPYDHPLYIRERVSPWLLQRLRREHTLWQARRFRPLPQVERLLSLRQFQAEHELAVLKASWARTEEQQKELGAWVEEVERLLKEVEILTSERESSETELERLYEENESLQAKVRSLSWSLSQKEGANGEEGMQGEAQLPDPATPLEAVERAQAEFAGTLAITDHAIDTARRMDPRPGRAQKVWKALGDLHQVVLWWQEGRLGAGGFGGALQKLGWTLALCSDVTIGLYRRQYEFSYDGRTVCVSPHVKLGRGERVYWFVDEPHKRFAINHVGAHLPDSTTG